MQYCPSITLEEPCEAKTENQDCFFLSKNGIIVQNMAEAQYRKCSVYFLSLLMSVHVNINYKFISFLIATFREKK